VSAVLIRGEDPALVADVLRQKVDELLGGEDRSLALEDLGGEEVTISSVLDACATPPMLASRRVVVVRDAGRFSAEELEPLMSWLADPLPTTALVLVAGGGQIPTRLVNAVKKAGSVIDVSTPPERARPAWVLSRAKEGPVRLSARAASVVADHLGEDLGRLPMLLEELASAYGEGARIDEAQVEPFLGEAGGVAPWDLTDAIDRADTEAALRALHRLLDGGQRHPMVVMAGLIRHFQNMLRLDGAGVSGEEEAAALLGSAPYPAKKALAQVGRLGTSGAARAICLLADADLDLRGMKEWPDPLVLEVLVARLSRLAPRRR